MKRHTDTPDRPRVVHFVWAAVFLLVLIWSYTSQPFGNWGAWFAFVVSTVALLVAFWDATETVDANPRGLAAILLAVLASAFNGDRAVAALQKPHPWLTVIDIALLAVTALVLVGRGYHWDKRYRKHQE